MNQNHHMLNRFDPSTVEKVERLLQQMTLEEKVGQLVQESVFAPLDWSEVLKEQKAAELRGEQYTIPMALKPDVLDRVRAGTLGVVFSADTRFNNQLQHAAFEESRLHIPLLVGHDVIHGLRTVFPIPLAEACTWNPELLEQVSAAAAAEAAATGINWVYAPMVDIARDPRWGRVAEGAGEDVYLGMRMAEARVRGFQTRHLSNGWRISACPKHYVGYGAAEAGRDYNTTDFSERTLRDVYLPPFKAAFDAGAGSTMSSFNEIGGIPVTSSSFLLRTILRDEWGWQGVVVSDFNAIGELVQHGAAKDLREAARLSILAGVDIDMESGAYTKNLAELVRDGSVPVALVDEAVRRVLHLKFGLGLFENPYVDEALAGKVILNPDFRALALETARQSMVLLKNHNQALPLPQGQGRVALIGPLAKNRTDLLGAWAIAGQAADVETVLDGMLTYTGKDRLVYESGCELESEEPADFSAALAAAHNADVVVIVVGEGSGMSGEAHSRALLGLPGRQQELVNALATTGKPLVAVLMSGRPLVIPELVDKVDALLVAWHGGIRAGKAVADLLFGAANPSGRLTASWPRAVGQIPVYYAHKNTGRPAGGHGTTQFHEPFRSTYMDIPNAPLFAFGEGLSYTTFEYFGLEVQTPVLDLDGILRVKATIKNTGGLPGVETAQLYIRDVTGSVTRPVKELKGFQRVALEAGEECQVQFAVPVGELGFHGPDLRYGVEPGDFIVWIGPDSTRGLEGKFEIRP